MAKQQKNSKRKFLAPWDIFFFCAQAADLLEAGIPLADGLDAMLEDTEASSDHAVITELRNRLEDRQPLSEAMRDSGYFPPYAVHMAQAGERTGQSDIVMRELSAYYAQEAQVRAALKNALFYPLVMATIMLAVLFLLSVWVMPVFESVFTQLGAAFSPFTRLVVNVVAIVSGAGLGLIALVGVTALLLWLTGQYRTLSSSGLWRKFVSGSKVSLRIGEGRFARTVALALRSGLDFDRGLELAISVVGNPVMEEKIQQCRGELDEGKSFYDAVRTAGLFTGMQRQRLRVGVRAGRFDEAMAQISQSCSQEASELASRMVTRLEPVLTAVMSAIAGGILVLVMLPLLGILSSIG